MVPICISDIDFENRPVVPAWIEAVKPIAEPLRKMTRRITRNVLHVSQVTEEAVHSLSANNGENLEQDPSARVYIAATWRAKDLKAGGRRSRLGLDCQLADWVTEALREPRDFAKHLEQRDLVDRLRAKATANARPDLAILINQYLSDAEDQIPQIFGVRPNSRERNTLSQRLHRGMRRLVESL